MKRKLLIPVFFIVFSFSSAYTQNSERELPFSTIQRMAWEGNYSEARNYLSDLLKANPDNLDYRFLEAQTYSWEGNYDKARRLYNKIHSSERKSEEYWIAAINNEIYDNNYNIALGLANKALVYLPDSENLSNKREEIIKNTQEKVFSTQSSELKDFNSSNTITASSSVEVFENIFDPMTAHQLKLGWEIGGHRLEGQFTQAQRFSVDGSQLGLSFYPRFGNRGFAYTEVAFSSSPIFPEIRISGQLYWMIKKTNEISLGGRYLSFENAQSASVLTGSFGKYQGDWYWRGTAYYTFPKDDKGGYAFNIMSRKYLKDRNTYCGVEVGGGIDTQLNQFLQNGQLLSETLSYLDRQYLRLDYQTSILRGKAGIGFGLGLARQEQAFDLGNYLFVGEVSGRVVVNL